MSIEEELRRRQVFEIYPGDRVYLSHLYYPVQLLKNNLKRKKEAKIVNDYENADIIIIDEVFLYDIVSSKKLHDPRQALSFEDRPCTPSQLRLKEAIAYMLKREDTRYMLLKDVYPLFLKTVNSEEVTKIQEAFKKGTKIGTMFLGAYDPYSVLDRSSLDINMNHSEIWKLNKLYVKTQGGRNYVPGTLTHNKEKLVSRILRYEYPFFEKNFKKVVGFFKLKEDKIIRTEIEKIGPSANLTLQIWKSCLKEVIAS